MIEERRRKKARVNTSRTRTKQESMEENSKIHKVKKSVIAYKEAFLAKIAEKAERAATVGHQGTLY